MTTAEVQEHIAALPRFNADFTHIEAKEANTDLPQRAWQTVSAFSNTHGGGTIIFGVAERQKFQIIGVRDAAKLQHDFASLCSDEMEPPIRPAIELHSIKGKHVVTATGSRTSIPTEAMLLQGGRIYKRRLHTCYYANWARRKRRQGKRADLLPPRFRRIDEG